MDSLTPNIFVRSITETINFYKELGFNIKMSMPETGEPDWVMMTNGNVTFMFQTWESLGHDLREISRRDGGSLLLYINITGIRSFFERIKDKVTVLKGLEKTFYGATEFSIVDVNNYVLTFAEDEGI